ncbi:MAG TPA: hypothetical protein VMM58_07230 [Bacteroidota bacterium]|nr:hypothetical protein [Bacteroidota bacterium]
MNHQFLQSVLTSIKPSWGQENVIQLWAGCNPMEVMFHNHIGIQYYLTILLKESYRVQNERCNLGICEERYPLDYGGWIDFVAAACMIPPR